MGQQQLLLLVLAAIIVGVGVIVGINTFGSSADEANRDSMIQDCLAVAAKAQEWYRKPVILGGGGHTFSAVTIDTLKWDTPNANGKYSLAILASGDSLQIDGTSLDDDRIVRVVIGSRGVGSVNKYQQ